MADPTAKARRTVKRAQEKFNSDVENAREARRRSFAQAHEEGLSLRQIAAEIGMHFTRVGEILKGK